MFKQGNEGAPHWKLENETKDAQMGAKAFHHVHALGALMLSKCPCYLNNLQMQGGPHQNNKKQKKLTFGIKSKARGIMPPSLIATVTSTAWQRQNRHTGCGEVQEHRKKPANYSQQVCRHHQQPSAQKGISSRQSEMFHGTEKMGKSICCASMRTWVQIPRTNIKTRHV